jgi:Ca-activated chloride channel homolog
MTLGWLPSALSPYRMVDTRSEEGGAELVTEDGRSLPLVSATLRVDAGGGIARAVLEQTFENASDDVLRVTYKMPLPADGAVSGYAFTIGARTIKGRVDAKAAARERFEQALVEGKTAALLEQDRQDIFTQEIGNIPPRTTIVARVTVDQRLAWLAEGEWELRFPTVIGPRYSSTPEDANAVATETVDKTRSRLHLEVRVTDAITPGRRVESPSHGLSARADGVVELGAPSGARLDRDVVVRWAVAKPQVGVSIQTARKGEDVFGLVTIVPPAAEARAATIPRDLIVLLDTSGSMGGTPLDTAKSVIASLVATLSPEDRLELVEFSSEPRRWRVEPCHATARDKKDALAWLGRLQAGGATEMHAAVTQALRSLRAGAQRQVVLVTDGYIGGEEQILALMHERLPEGCRMHFVGVGAAPNRSLATSMARAGRGAEILVGPGEDVERGVKRLLARTCAPVLTDVTIEGDALGEQAPAKLPDVFAGSPVLAAVKLAARVGGELVVRGKLAHGTWQQRIRVPSPEEGDSALAALFAREKVADLDIRASFEEDTRAIDAEIEAVGVAFQIATRMTSWVAVDEEASVDPYAPSRTEVIPQELPYGTSMASFGAPMPTSSGAFEDAGVLSSMSLAMVDARAPAYGAPMEALRGQRTSAPGGAPPPRSKMMMQTQQGAHLTPLGPTKRRARWPFFVVLFLLLAILATVLWLLFR